MAVPMFPSNTRTVQGLVGVIATITANHVTLRLEGGGNLQTVTAVKLSKGQLLAMLADMDQIGTEIAAETAVLDQPGPPPDLDQSDR